MRLKMVPSTSLPTMSQQCKKHTIDDHFLIANQTAEALTFMRNSKPRIIHRDVKPANILIGEDMHV
jgi:serine/threonine protein kinase